MKYEKQYIGDGVYIEYTGWDFVLSTKRDSGPHFIHLEPMQINAINKYCLSCTVPNN